MPTYAAPCIDAAKDDAVVGIEKLADGGIDAITRDQRVGPEGGKPRAG
ncbi:MAG TPA: hypothetical protein VH020_10120 [Stellaceae bacterium]|nr:hypothetical protein [Stellaceae bacterium]